MFTQIQKIKAINVENWLALNPKNIEFIKEELIFPQTEVEYQTFKTLFDRDINFKSQKITIPPFYVRSIKNGKCYTQNGIVFTHDNYALSEYSCQELHPFSKKRQYKLNKPKKISGKVALLSIDPIHTSYYHWMIESLPRLYLIEKSSFKPDKYIVCNITKFQKQALEMLGISENRIIKTENNDLIQADELIVTDLINNFELIYFKDIQYYSKKYFPKWICDFYKEHFVSQVKKTEPKKIYISRNDAIYRKVLNEQEIVECLASKGFQSYQLEKMTLKEQVELFANADIIVSPHGAGLTNLVFCPSSSKVIEFYPSNYTDIGQRIIADTLNIDYRYILGEKADKSNLLPQFEDIYLDINKLEKTLEDIENPQKIRPAKKELAIVLGTTGNMTFATANVLMGLKKHLKNVDFEVIIYIQGVSEKDRKLLYKILPCRFIEYKLPNTNIRGKTIKRYSNLAYSKYECFDLLDYYKKVLWLDIDILIKKDLTEFINSCQNGISLWQSNITTQFNFTQKIEPYDMNIPCYNSGIMLLTDNLPNYQKLTKWCYDKTEEYGKLLVCADQGIINLMIQEFNLNVDKISEDFNCHPVEGKNPEKAIILHTYAEEKFWNFYFNYNEWNKNYKKWIEIGGTPYKGKKANFLTKLARKFKLKFMPEAPHPICHIGKFWKYVYEYNFKKQV